MRLLGLEFKSGNMITSKAIKNIVKKYYSIRSNCLILLHIKTMEIYYVNCEKNIANKNSGIRRNKQNREILLSSCVVCGKKKYRFIKSQEASNFELLKAVFNN